MSDRSMKPTPIGRAQVLKAVSLREQIYQHLRERIQSGQLTFDDRLVDVDIASEFGVSRMPVREALMQLVHDGMIESSTRGFILRRYSDQEVADTFEIRRLLEPAAAEIAARKMTDEALLTMDRAIHDGIKASEANDFSAFVVANAAFRGAWLAQVPNAQLVAALARYIDHVQIVRLVTLPQRPVRDDVLGRLRLIHAAFSARDASRVGALFREHVDAAVLAYRTYRK
ncbi:MAG: GntR family transcriptional regulator [Pseudorhodoplanes sp.]